MQEPHPDGRIPDSSIYGQFLESVHEMDAQALLAAWDSLQTARLSPPERQRLRSTLVEALLKKDAELALNQFATHAADLRDPMAPQLFGGFRRWAVTSPSKAAFWLDQNIAAGNFSDPQAADPAAPAKIRLNYERELIRVMIGLGQDQAALRMETVPPALRADVLKGMDPARNQSTYAQLIRKYLEPRDQEQEFIRMAKTAAYQGGKPGVAALLDLIHASPAERERILRETADFNPGVIRKEKSSPSD